MASLRVGVAPGDRGLSAPPALARLAARTSRLGGWRRYALAFTLGAVAVPALPPVHFVPALAPSFVGLLWLAQGARIGGLLALGFAFGLGYFTVGLYWVANALLTKPDQFGLVAPLAPVGLALILAPFLSLPVVATRLARPGGIGQVIVFAAAWTAAEWLRSWLFTGFPWNLIGTVWTFAPAMLQPAAVVGVYGIGLVTVIAAAMPAVLTWPAIGRGRAVTAVTVALLVPVAAGGAGAWRLDRAGDAAAVEGIRLRLVQPNIPQGVKWQADLVDAHLLDQVRLGSLDVGPPPTHVIWSEVAAPMFLAESPERLALVGAHTPAGGLTLLGTLRRSPPGHPFRLWNSLIAIDPDGAVVGSYDKSHLVPFGEYMPLRPLVDIASATGFADFSAGSGITTLRLPDLPPVSPLICYEAIFPAAVADPRARPDWLLNITNDGWYGYSAGPFQHLAAARLRAVEEGLPLVRVANTGISALIDPYGRIIRSLGLGERGVLDGELPQKLGEPTIYARLGNFPVLACAGLLLLFGALLSRRS
jgi:apolipoprotein N-acyltransferase